MSRTRKVEFCPVAAASEILGRAASINLIHELCDGARDLDELRRGAPKLSRQQILVHLKEMEMRGLLRTRPAPTLLEPTEVQVTQMGSELCAVIHAMETWGQKWLVRPKDQTKIDARLLMLRIKNALRTEFLPQRPTLMQFSLRKHKKAVLREWIFHCPGESPSLLSTDPDSKADFFVSAEVNELAEVFFGLVPLESAIAEERILTIGDPEIEQSMSDWFGRSQ